MNQKNSTQTNNPEADPTGVMRWWVYQRERFPLFQHGVLVLAFSACAVLYSSTLRDADSLPPASSFIVAFITCLTLFLQLRIADEFKDFHEDSTYRPYRAVPRGLVSLRELGWLFVIVSGLQLCLALWLDWRLIGLLLVTWVYLAAMSKEFFVGDWLREKPVLYTASHMMIMPLIDLYATGCDWVPLEGVAPAGLGYFLAASYFNGLVIEVGRKIRAQPDEEVGVKTYSAIWGRQRAVLVWLGAIAITGLLAGMAGNTAGVPWLVLVYAGLWACCCIAAVLFLRAANSANPAGAGKKIELLSGVWTLGLYLALGLIPTFLN